MKRNGRALALLLALFMAVACAGCVSSGAEGLYALPQMSDEYLQLEQLIATRIRDGSEYAAPIAGSNRQSVQLRDLDGDGEPEAIAFLADSGHTPTVCVYRRNGAGDFYLYVIIGGEGSAVSSVEYADLTGDGAAEVVIAWQISGELRLLSVYSLKPDFQTELMSAGCSEFFVSDLDGDGIEDLLNLSVDYAGASSLLRYTFDAEGNPGSYEARLSVGITEVLRSRVGRLADGAAALFVESRWGGEELVTDVFTADGGLSNVTLTPIGWSNTLRAGEAFAEDINGDRVMEIPEGAADILDWFAFDSAGNKTRVMTTCHDYEDGWYLALPESVSAEGLRVLMDRTVPGEAAAALLQETDSGETETLLTVYTLTGENRMDRASAGGRFVLRQNETTVFAAELSTSELTAEDVSENFNLIYPDWQVSF